MDNQSQDGGVNGQRLSQEIMTGSRRPQLVRSGSGQGTRSIGKALMNNQRSLSSLQSNRLPMLNSKQSMNGDMGGSGTGSIKALSGKQYLNHHGSGNNSMGLPSRGGRSRSGTQTGPLYAHTPNYQFQEKLYLKRMRNQVADDYYTKGIGDADLNMIDSDVNALEDDDDDDDEDQQAGNGDFLADIDDDKYQIDFNLTLALLKNGKNKINIDSSNKASLLSRETVEDPAIVERLEWQSMLMSVLTGDVLKSEKTKIINSNNVDIHGSFLHAKYKESLWLGIRAKLLDRTEDEHRKFIAYRRTEADSLFEEILRYTISYDSVDKNPPRQQVVRILDRYEKCCDLWRTLEEMKNEKPVTASAEFQGRIDALNAWLVVTDAIERITAAMRVWVGNDELDITKNSSDVSNSPSLTTYASTDTNKAMKDLFDEEKKSLAERLMKEKDVQYIFEKRLLLPLSVWMTKAKITYIKLGLTFESLRLPDYVGDLIRLCQFPMKLIKEIIKMRLLYAKKLVKPTLMMIDQMIDDFKTYISIAIGVKLALLEYCRANENKTWVLDNLFDIESLDFDNVVLECVRYFFELLHKKLLDGSRSPTNFRTFKEPEELEETWNYVRWLGDYIEGGSIVVSENITLLTQKLIRRLLAYFNNQVKILGTNDYSNSDLIRWFSSTTENFGQLRRKLARFTGELSRDLTNSLVFDISTTHGNATKSLMEHLKATNHFLVFTNTVENQGTYFFASSDLIGRESIILKLLNGEYIGSNPDEFLLDFANLLRKLQIHEINSDDSNYLLESDITSLSGESNDLCYVLAICPPKPIIWEGQVVTLDIPSVPITDVDVGQMLVITKLPYYNLHIIRERFIETMNEISIAGIIGKTAERRCSLAKVHLDLTKINRIFFRMSLSVIDSARIIRARVRDMSTEGGSQELINNYFIFAKEYGKNSVRNQDSSRKSTIIMKLIKLSIEWVSFVCDDCNPTDQRTFRACVLALEFAMDMTRGFNVLVLSDEQFNDLRLKVARCMSLLISHFDIMGARSSEAEKKKLLKWSSQKHRIENSADDESIIKEYKKDVMREIQEIELYRKQVEEEQHAIGRVIDKEDLEYQFVTLLASSFSSVSIRWQKGRFIGGGSFGSVYAAVNLDTGGVMAVKEIKFYDSQSIKEVVPAIRDEMRILEMLNHPNVVQYFGVEIHRHKVYIFMEFCEGGSLSNYLSYGRIEDEMVIQVYTLQMLEGLAYLHQSGVVHRDIKPENILLDHNGVIKFVDFGAAKMIATTGRTRTGGSRSATSSQKKSLHLNSMTGTPMYMSPEVITGSATNRSVVCDIWSLGCCVLEMSTGMRPWANLDNEWAIMYHIAAGHKPQLPSHDQLSQAGIDFISRCLVHDPKDRPDALELLSDPWIVQIRQVAFLSSESGSLNSSEVSSDAGTNN